MWNFYLIILSVFGAPLSDVPKLHLTRTTSPPKPTYATGLKPRPRPTYDTGLNPRPRPTYATGLNPRPTGPNRLPRSTYATGPNRLLRPTYANGLKPLPRPTYATGLNRLPSPKKKTKNNRMNFGQGNKIQERLAAFDFRQRPNSATRRIRPSPRPKPTYASGLNLRPKPATTYATGFIPGENAENTRSLKNM